VRGSWFGAAAGGNGSRYWARARCCRPLCDRGEM
jgi:hypothetical protein